MEKFQIYNIFFILVISRKLVRKALEMLKNIASSADEDDEEEEEEESSDKEGE